MLVFLHHSFLRHTVVTSRGQGSHISPGAESPQVRRITAGGAEKSQKCHKQFPKYRKFASEGAQVQKRGRHACFLPRAPCNLVTPLLRQASIWPCETLEYQGTIEPCKLLKLICWLILKKFVATSKRLFFYDLLTICVSGKTNHHYQRSTFLIKRCLIAVLVRNMIFFN